MDERAGGRGGVGTTDGDRQRRTGWFVVAGGVLLALVVALAVRPWDDGSAGPSQDAAVQVPRGSAAAATLVLDARAGDVRVAAGAAAGDLLDARGAGADASADHDGTGDEHEVRVTGTSATVRLAGDVAWTLLLTVGADDVTLDLGELDVRAVEVAGGAGAVVLSLPAAADTPRATVSAGVDTLAVRLVDGDAARVLVESGAGSATVDGTRTDGLGAGSEVTTDGLEVGGDHWEVVVAGGAGSITVDRAP
ncbi:hypothetical protein [Cellulomonas phragmiteti]|uniref:Adhesin domain-containing protein n=1 Tax=Cellulomonas phragmiteti TaxID=478780 RepID=A0ABQ4DI08_9CELL|nr:hypothetical protein [Cellulomonas phragmiteti]GIG38969.1 hypothetical protein Cph01nite_07310 [Cellulomonas phragmiteti]